MGDWLQFVVDEHVSAGDAEHRAAALRANLVAVGWITRCDAPVPGRSVHRPGAQVDSWYARAAGEVELSRFVTNEVAVETGPFTNLAAGPFDTELRCAACEAPVDEPALLDRIESWLESGTEPLVTCLRCGRDAHVRTLHGAGCGVLCGHLALTFYNWPPLEDARWHRSIVEVISGSIGARPSIAWAKL
jgi:hypothetical protein